VVKNESNPTPLPNNPTVAQIRFHNKEVVKEGRALAIIHAIVHDDAFINTMNLETGKEACDKFKEEFQHSERITRMNVLNMRKEIEAIKIKDSEPLKEFTDIFSKVVTDILLLSEELKD